MKLWTHLPRALKKYTTFSLFARFVSGMWMAFGKHFLMIDCKRPCGAISIVIASFGKFLAASSNKTGLNRLFVWYSAELNRFCSSSQFSFGTLELIHFSVRRIGSGIVSFNIFSRSGPIPAMYCEWYAIFPQATSLANISFAFSSSMNLATSSFGPDIVDELQLQIELKHHKFT